MNKGIKYFGFTGVKTTISIDDQLKDYHNDYMVTRGIAEGYWGKALFDYPSFNPDSTITRTSTESGVPNIEGETVNYIDLLKYFYRHIYDQSLYFDKNFPVLISEPINLKECRGINDMQGVLQIKNVYGNLFNHR